VNSTMQFVMLINR